MPCLTDFEQCEKVRCDENCITCVHFKPSRHSKYYRCGNPDVKVAGCLTKSKDCPDCEFYLNSRTKASYYSDNYERLVDWRIMNPDKVSDQRKRRYERDSDKDKENVQNWRENNRERYNEYMRELRRAKKSNQ